MYDSLIAKYFNALPGKIGVHIYGRIMKIKAFL